MERVARGYLSFRLCLRGGQEASDVLSRVGSGNGSLFEDSATSVREKRDYFDALRPVSSDKELMATFRPAKKNH